MQHNMKKDSRVAKLFKRVKKQIKETNFRTYLTLLVFFTALFLLSLFFDTTEKPFTIFSSIGCGGIASVVVAWLVEVSNNKITRNRNEIIVSQLLYGFDAYVMIECQRALGHCAKSQDIDIDKSYSISEICSMLNKADSKAVYFRGFSDMIQKGLNGVTEITLLSFDQSERGRTLYDLFLALRSTMHTMSDISENENFEELQKMLVIDCFNFIDHVNTARGQNCTYQLSDESKKYITSFKKALKNQKKND